MFMRPVKTEGPRRHGAAQKTRYEAVWVTCDDLAHEGILVPPSPFLKPPAFTLKPAAPPPPLGS